MQVYPSSEEAVKDIGDNSTILFGGFGVCGTIETTKLQLYLKQNQI